jgi:hypothetical protein
MIESVVSEVEKDIQSWERASEKLLSSAEELSRMMIVVACAGGRRLCMSGSAHGVEHGGSSLDMDNADIIHRVRNFEQHFWKESKTCRMKGK